MTDPFMRVDVSQTSRDFQPVALEPGLPMLDRSNSNGQTLRKWLGAYVAEPERVGDRVSFFVRNEEGRRLEEVFCVPVSDKDLTGELAKEFSELRKRIEAAKPQSSNEQLIHRVVLGQIRGLSDEAQARDRRCCLFKYRDGQKKLRMVWCPGYRRRDQESVSPLICTHSTCSHLFLQRRDSGAKCPVCSKIRGDDPPPRPPWNWRRALKTLVAVVFFVALGVGGAFWWQKQQPAVGPGPVAGAKSPLSVEPASWTGPVGSQVPFVINRHDEKGSEVVTAAAAATVANPKVLAVKPYENIGKALNPGKTEVTFFVGSLTVQASVTVEPRSNPNKLTLQPEKLELGVGTTANIKLIGEYADGRKVDLTEDADWGARHDDKFFVHRGRVEGEEAGTGTLRVRYRANESAEVLETTAEVTVRDHQYKALKLAIEPSSPKVGEPLRIVALATTEVGQDVPVGDAKDLKVEAVPKERATVRGTEVTTLAEGEVKFTAQFRGLSATLDAKIAKSDSAPRTLEVSPKTLDLKVGEVAKLSVLSGQPTAVKIASKQPQIVEVAADGRLIGRGIGSAEIEVRDGGEPVKVTATVTVAEWKSIVIEPSRLTIRSDESATVRVFGVIDDANRIELAPDQVTWVALPRPEFVEFDKAAMQLKGLKSTSDQPERLTARSLNQEATTDIQVVAPPLTLTLLPEGSIEIPLGQKRALRVQAQYAGAAATDIAAERIEWLQSAPEGFDIKKNGEIHALGENFQIRVSAKYQGATSNELRVASVPATPLKLRLTADPATVAVGGVGQIHVTAEGPAGPVSVSEDGLLFVSGKSDIVQVVDTSGAFRGISPGTASVRAMHVAAKEGADVSITVTAPIPEVVAKPASVRLVSREAQPIQLPLEAEFSDWRVEAVAADGKVTDVSRKATLELDGDPTKAAAAIRDGRIVGVRPGEAMIQASYAGVRSTEGLRLQITSALEIDEIRVSPARVSLVVGESASLQAVGFKAGKSVGAIANRSELVWKAKDDGPIQLDGPSVYAKSPGETSVTAQLGPAVSQPITVTVLAPTDVGRSPAAVGPLTVTPSQLRLKAGEVVHLGTDVSVKRGETDFSQQCEVVPASTRIVAFDESNRLLQAVSPGRTRVTFTVRDQAAILDIEVRPEDVAPADSKVIIEPATGRLAIGERLPLRVFVVTPDGQRQSVTAAFSSKNSDVASITESALQGLTAGEATVEARVPGIDSPGQAVFQVEQLEIQKLVFSPAVLTMSAGQRKHFVVEAITPNGRKKLGDDSDLKLTMTESGGKVVELSAPSRELLGLEPGKAAVVATWKGQMETKLPITVQADPIQELVIEPDDALVAEGESLDFQVFARRSGRLQPLQADDGVELRVANPVLAQPDRTELRVTGLQTGKTQVAVRFGSRRAVAQLTVTPRPQPPAPPPSAVSLRFIPDFRQMDLGYPGDGVRVVRVLADGTEQDVDHLVTLTPREEGIVSIDPTASGPVVRPKKVGQTQIDATLEDLKTRKPLLVEVAKRIPRQHQIRVRPSSLTLTLGETGSFARVEILPAAGGSPIPVAFKVTATPNKTIEILPSGSIRGLAPGQAAATITAVDPQGKYDGMATSATVEVVDPDAQQDKSRGTAPAAPQLVIQGASETTVGAEVPLRVESVLGDHADDVTSQAQLVLVAGEEQLAEIRPGAAIFAKSPGRISVQARWNDQTSAPHEILIRPLDKEFERLELDLDRRRLGVSEARSYQLWGYPRGGGSRQDLTRLVTTEESAEPTRPRMRLQMMEPNPGTQVVSHKPGTLTGRLPGRFKLQARLGEKLSTDEITLEVVGTDDRPERMRVEPEQLQLLAGETTPHLKVLVASQGDRNFRALDPALVEISALNPDILKPGETGQFLAVRPGQTTIKVAFQGLEQDVPVTVKFNPFASIVVGPNPKFAESTMTVDLKVTANTSDAELEYRTALPNAEGRAGSATTWTRAERDGDQLSVNLRSPRIPLLRGQNHYSILIEAKHLKTGTVERHPFPFKIVSTSGAAKPAESK